MGEKRRHNRLVLSLPVRFHDIGAGLGEGEGALGIVKNISLGGLYFECPQPVNLKQGQILQFTIFTSLPSLDIPGTSNLAARGEVLRLDQLLGANRACGVAVRFLGDLAFANI